MQGHQKEVAQQIKQQNQILSHIKSDLEVKQSEATQRADLLENEVKLNLKEMVKERQEDIEMLSKMVDGAHKKVMADLNKR